MGSVEPENGPVDVQVLEHHGHEGVEEGDQLEDDELVARQHLDREREQRVHRGREGREGRGEVGGRPRGRV